jgi:hypothetical protein
MIQHFDGSNPMGIYFGRPLPQLDTYGLAGLPNSDYPREPKYNTLKILNNPMMQGVVWGMVEKEISEENGKQSK